MSNVVNVGVCIHKSNKKVIKYPSEIYTGEEPWGYYPT